MQPVAPGGTATLNLNGGTFFTTAWNLNALNGTLNVNIPNTFSAANITTINPGSSGTGVVNFNGLGYSNIIQTNLEGTGSFAITGNFGGNNIFFSHLGLSGLTGPISGILTGQVVPPDGDDVIIVTPTSFLVSIIANGISYLVLNAGGNNNNNNNNDVPPVAQQASNNVDNQLKQTGLGVLRLYDQTQTTGTDQTQLSDNVWLTDQSCTAPGANCAVDGAAAPASASLLPGDPAVNKALDNAKKVIVKANQADRTVKANDTLAKLTIDAAILQIDGQLAREDLDSFERAALEAARDELVVARDGKAAERFGTGVLGGANISVDPDIIKALLNAKDALDKGATADRSNAINDTAAKANIGAAIIQIDGQLERQDIQKGERKALEQVKAELEAARDGKTTPAATSDAPAATTKGTPATSTDQVADAVDDKAIDSAINDGTPMIEPDSGQKGSFFEDKKNATPADGGVLQSRIVDADGKFLDTPNNTAVTFDPVAGAVTIKSRVVNERDQGKNNTGQGDDNTARPGEFKPLTLLEKINIDDAKKANDKKIEKIVKDLKIIEGGVLRDGAAAVEGGVVEQIARGQVQVADVERALGVDLPDDRAQAIEAIEALKGQLEEQQAGLERENKDFGDALKQGTPAPAKAAAATDDKPLQSVVTLPNEQKAVLFEVGKPDALKDINQKLIDENNALINIKRAEVENLLKPSQVVEENEAQKALRNQKILDFQAEIALLVLENQKLEAQNALLKKANLTPEAQKEFAAAELQKLREEQQKLADEQRQQDNFRKEIQDLENQAKKLKADIEKKELEIQEQQVKVNALQNDFQEEINELAAQLRAAQANGNNEAADNINKKIVAKAAEAFNDPDFQKLKKLEVERRDLDTDLSAINRKINEKKRENQGL